MLKHCHSSSCSQGTRTRGACDTQHNACHVVFLGLAAHLSALGQSKKESEGEGPLVQSVCATTYTCLKHFHSPSCGQGTSTHGSARDTQHNARYVVFLGLAAHLSALGQNKKEGKGEGPQVWSVCVASKSCLEKTDNLYVLKTLS